MTVENRLRPKAWFLVGPTASGKTAVAQCIAEQKGWDILSADSMLVYRGMDIGTAKPPVADRKNVRYFGIDLIAPGECFSVGDYVRHAALALEQAARDGRDVIVVGGTGLYVKCLIEGLSELPAANPELRARAETLLAEKGVEALQDELRRRDPARFAALKDPENPRRLIRALEMAAAPAGRGNRWQGTAGPALAGLAVEPALLKKRIEERARRMYHAGLVDETAALMKPSTMSKTALQAIGYAEALEVLNGACSVPEAIERTAARTRQLAKRQMTWFRHQANVEWVNADDDQPVDRLAAAVMKIWRTHGSTPVVI